MDEPAIKELMKKTESVEEKAKQLKEQQLNPDQ